MSRLFIIFIFFTNAVIAQQIELNGSILQKEYTDENKISGFFTYSNLTEELLKLEIVNGDNNNSKTIDINPNSGKQIKVIDQKFGASNTEFVSGNFDIVFYLVNNESNRKSNILVFSNIEKYPPTLRGVGITFTEKSDDSEGDYFEVKIEWKTILNGSYTETRKCYVTKGN